MFMITSMVFLAQYLQSETSGASADVVYDRQQLLSPRTCLWESGCKSFDTNIDGTPYLGSCRPTTLDSACSIKRTLFEQRKPYRWTL